MARAEVYINGSWVWVGGFSGTGPQGYPMAASGTTTTGGAGAIAIAGAPVSHVMAAAGNSTSINGNAAIVVPASGITFLSLPGTSGSYAYTATQSAFNLSGTHTIKCRIRRPDWTPAARQSLVSKWGASGQWSWYWRLQTTGAAGLLYSTNGTASAAQNTAAPSPELAANTWIWILLDVNRSTGAIDFYTHPDQAAEPTSGWTLIASNPSPAAFGSLFGSTANLAIGADSAGTYEPLQADIAQLIVFNDVGTKVFQLDPQNWSAGSTWVTSLGHTVTLGGSATIGSA